MKKRIYLALSKMARLAKQLDTSTDLDLYVKLYPEESIQKKKFCNVGAGKFTHPCWTNIDDGSDYYESANKNNRLQNRINHDLFSKKPLPLNDNDTEVVYTSHTLEHIDNDSVIFFLRESHRILKDKGVLRIVVPDIDLSYRAWRRNDRDYFYWTEWEHVNKKFEEQCIILPLKNASLTQIFLEDFAADASEIAATGATQRISDTEMQTIFDSLPYEEALDYCIAKCSIQHQKQFPFRHMNWFNEAKLRAFLKDAGFKTIIRSGYLQSTAPVLRNRKIFDSTMPQISLYMEAIK